MTDVTAGGPRKRRIVGLALVVAPLATVAALALAAGGDAKARPTCFSKPATIVGTNGPDVISTKLTAGKDIVAARGGNDRIEASSNRNNHGEDIICGDGGNDKITGNNDDNTLIGGPGNDDVKGAPGDDLIVGDNANPKGPESGTTGKDDLNGTGGKDFVVGDNYASGNATGGTGDKDIVGLDANDRVVGDNVSLNGNAIGGGGERMAGADGDDLVVGDNYAPHGTASGNGDDVLNAGPDNDLLVGDNYTTDGRVSGGGEDSLQGPDGGDLNEKCKPKECDDVFYGDNYVAACAPNPSPAAQASLAVIRCQAKRAPGGAPDRLTPDQGDDFMNGGFPDDPNLRAAGDVCSGGKGNDTGTRCELYAKGDTEHVIAFP